MRGVWKVPRHVATIFFSSFGLVKEGGSSSPKGVSSPSFPPLPFLFITCLQHPSLPKVKLNKAKLLPWGLSSSLQSMPFL